MGAYAGKTGLNRDRVAQIMAAEIWLTDEVRPAKIKRDLNATEIAEENRRTRDRDRHG